MSACSHNVHILAGNGRHRPLARGAQATPETASVLVAEADGNRTRQRRGTPLSGLKTGASDNDAAASLFSEWTAGPDAGQLVGITALELGDDGLITSITSVYDSRQIDQASKRALLEASFA